MARFCFPECTHLKQQKGGAASEAASVISANRVTLRAALDLMLGGDAGKMKIENLPERRGFAVGATVDVAKRMGPGVNKPGGVATVTEATAKGGSVIYGVQYVLGGGEKNLPQDLLSPPPKAGKRRASPPSSSPVDHDGGASAESRKYADALRGLDEQLTALRQEAASVRWEAARDRQKAAAHRQLVKETAAELAASSKEMMAAGKEIDRLNMENQAATEKMHASVLALMDEAAATAAGEAESKLAGELKGLRSQLRKEEKKRKAAEEKAKTAQNTVTAQHDMMMANMNALLDDAKGAAEEEVAVELGEAKADADGARQMLAAAQQPASSLVRATAALGVHSEVRLTAAAGSRSASFLSMGKRDRDAVRRASAADVLRILELASPIGDAADAAPGVFSDRRLRGICSQSGSAVLAELPRLKQLEKNVAAAFRIFTEQKEAMCARQMLSLFPASYKVPEIVATCSSPLGQISTGDTVRVGRGGKHGASLQYGRVVGLDGSTASVTLLNRTSGEKKQRFATVGQSVGTAVAAAASGETKEFPLSSLRLASHVAATEYQVYEARRLAALTFPGSQPAAKQNFERQSKTLGGVLQLAEHLANEEYFALAEASRRNAERGVKYLRTMSMRRSFRLLKEQCKVLNVPVIRWPDYHAILSSREYDKMTILNCVCVYCRALIYEATGELKELAELVLFPADVSRRLLRRIDQHMRYLSVEYPEKIAKAGDQHHDVHLCARLALSAANYAPFSCPCTHGLDGGGTVGDAPESMDDVSQRLHGRAAEAGDWDDLCGNGCGKDKGKFWMCNDCAVVWCRPCIEHTVDDIGEASDDHTGWRCPTCQAEWDKQRHTNDDAQLHDGEWIAAEVLNAATVCGLKPEASSTLPDDGCDSDGEEMEQDERARLREGLRLRLKEVLLKFRKARAHKMRTIQFRRRKHRIIRDLDEVTALEMKDYSGKLEARKSRQGTSENLGEKLSNHGSIFVFRNPSNDIREQHPEIDWTQFPSASEDVYLQVNAFNAADDSSQSAYHMGCNMEVSYTQLKEAFPWLSGVIPFSDQCGDYHSTASTIFNHEIGRLTGIHVVRAEHSEVGEGKGEVDMKFGILAQQFYTALAKTNRECAAHLFDHLELCKSPGNYNTEVEINRSLFKKGSSGAIPKHDQCQCITQHRDAGGITLHEFHGIGPGLRYSKQELQKYDHYGLFNSEKGTGSRAKRTSSGSMVPTTRHTHQQKQEAVQLKSEKQQQRADAKDAKQQENAAAAAAAVEKHAGLSSEERTRLLCGSCHRQYLSQKRFDRHVSSGHCSLAQEAAAAKARQLKNTRKVAEAMMRERREQQSADERDEQGQLATVEFEFKDPLDAAGLELEVGSGEGCGGVVVSSVSAARQNLALTILRGYRLQSVAGGADAGGSGDVSDEARAAAARAALGGASATAPVKLTFTKPPGGFPPHGWARKHLAIDSNPATTKAQAEFLEKHCAEHERVGSSCRAPAVHHAMTQLHGPLHVDSDGAPFVMSQSAIFNYLKRRWSTQKAAGINLALAAAAAHESTGNGGAQDDNETSNMDGGGGDDVDENDADYDSLLVDPLKEILRSRGLRVSGKKQELIQRLRDNDASRMDEGGGDDVDEDDADYDSMLLDPLKDILRSRGLRVSGKKQELIQRLRDDDDSDSEDDSDDAE